MLWENLREEEFESAIERSGGLCVLPLGCLEKHGQHLPMGTDHFEAVDIVRAAAELEDAVIFPTAPWLGEVSCFHAFPDPGRSRLRGCVGIKQQTLLTLITELCDEIARNGFDRILIVNGHGGNTPMLRHFLRMQTYTPKNYATMMTSAFAFGDIDPRRLYGTLCLRRSEFPDLTDEDMQTLKRFSETGTGGGHADIRETCLVMAHDRTLVAEDRYEAESGASTHRTDHLAQMGIESANGWLANYPTSYCALPPIGASPAIGRAMLRICAERLAAIYKTVKNDADCVSNARVDSLLKQ